MEIQQHSKARAREEEWGSLLCPFLKLKDVSWIWKNVPGCVHLWVALVLGNLPCPGKPLLACLHAGIILFAKLSILNV